MKKAFSLVILVSILSSCLSAQQGYIEKKDSLFSQLLNQNRQLSVFLPDGYAIAKKPFPVIYVLDADGRCQHTIPTARFLSVNGHMPQAIIVGVYNIDRNHDFLPAASPAATTGGGADSFIQFFKQELIPYIDKNYKTEAYKVLIGHSFGGVMAMQTLLTEPALFDAYIAIDPSFWYNDHMMVKNAKTELAKQKNWKRILYITGREGNGWKDMGVDAMEKTLKSIAPKDLTWTCVSYPGEDHGSVTFKSIYDGLRYIFDSNNFFSVIPQAGIVEKGKLAKAYVVSESNQLRYTTDGTEPNLNSRQCNKSVKFNGSHTRYIPITGACTIKVKAPSFKYGMQPAKPYVFEEGAPLNGIENTEGLLPGLQFSYYEGGWDSIPDFERLTPVKTGICDSIDLKMALKKDSFAIQYEGYLYIKETGSYIVYSVSDDGSKVFLNNKLIIHNDGLHSAQFPVAYMVPLKQGYFPVKIQFFEKGGDEVITVGYQTGKGKPVSITKDMLFHRK
jgi:predicted alpha/beta superfamily hydrolase